VVCFVFELMLVIGDFAGNSGKSRADVFSKARVKMKKTLIPLLAVLTLIQTSLAFADMGNGKNLYSQRCAVCHGADIKGTGPLARKSTPPTPDLTTAAFKKRLNDYPGVIVSSIILRPSGSLIPKTLRENAVKIPPHAWTINDLRDLNQYMSGLISKK
jgi:mono/diheme cytochrome c family protein